MNIQSPESSIALELNPTTGLPSLLTKVVAGVEQKQELECTLEIEINGDERRAPTGGIEYFSSLCSHY